MELKIHATDLTNLQLKVTVLMNAIQICQQAGLVVMTPDERAACCPPEAKPADAPPPPMKPQLVQDEEPPKKDGPTASERAAARRARQAAKAAQQLQETPPPATQTVTDAAPAVTTPAPKTTTAGTEWFPADAPVADPTPAHGPATVKEAIEAYAQEHGTAGVLAKLQAFGYKRGGDIPPEKQADFIAFLSQA